MTTNRMMQFKGSISRLRIALLEVLVSTLIGMVMDRYLAIGPAMSITGLVIGLIVASQHWMSVSNAHRQHEIVQPGSPQELRLRANRENASRRRVDEESIY